MDCENGNQGCIDVSTAGEFLKSKTGWIENCNGTDNFGFSALPGGYGEFWSGNIIDVGDNGYWWSATENNPEDSEDDGYAYYRTVRFGDDYVTRGDYLRGNSFSIRCIQN
jgi:uncharacterized protein (TIGR02145 family)